jgi:predicted membrane channel-forming protein YqfA (hemolysin III family)
VILPAKDHDIAPYTKTLSAPLPVNIWSHALGFALFCFLGVVVSWKTVFVPIADTRSIGDIVFFYTFIAGAMSCLGLSSTYHCLSCHSEPVSMMWREGQVKWQLYETDRVFFFSYITGGGILE